LELWLLTPHKGTDRQTDRPKPTLTDLSSVRKGVAAGGVGPQKLLPLVLLLVVLKDGGHVLKFSLASSALDPLQVPQDGRRSGGHGLPGCSFDRMLRGRGVQGFVRVVLHVRRFIVSIFVFVLKKK
jgi:hypothetical protein